MRNICFFAEKTLGKLSKWLRILGFDTLYGQDLWISRNMDAIEPGRILLTRTKATSDKAEGILYIRSNDPFEQLKEVIHHTGISRSDIKPFSRCIRCNSRIEKVNKLLLRGKVPDYVWDTQHNFFICKKCVKIYWPGSHIERSLERIDRLFT